MLEKFATKAAAEYLGVSKSTLDIWRSTGYSEAPPFVRIGARIFYLKRDLDAYIEARRVQPGV